MIYHSALTPVTYKPDREIKVISRTDWFRRRELDRHTEPAHLEERVSVYAEIKAVSRLLYSLMETLHRGVALARSAPVQPEMVLDYSSRDWKFSTACSHRELNSRYIINSIQALYAGLRRNDAALSEAMTAFNAIEPRKRNGSLSVSIQLRGTRKELRLGPGDPVFSTVSFRGGKRVIHPVKAGESDRSNRITRDVLRSRYLVRYSAPFLRYAREIERLRDERRQLRDSLEAFIKCFKPQIGEDS